MCACVRVCVCACVPMRIGVCTWVWVCVCLHVCVYVCFCMCMCMHVRVWCAVHSSSSPGYVYYMKMACQNMYARVTIIHSHRCIFMKLNNRSRWQRWDAILRVYTLSNSRRIQNGLRLCMSRPTFSLPLAAPFISANKSRFHSFWHPLICIRRSVHIYVCTHAHMRVYTRTGALAYCALVFTQLFVLKNLQAKTYFHIHIQHTCTHTRTRTHAYALTHSHALTRVDPHSLMLHTHTSTCTQWHTGF